MQNMPSTRAQSRSRVPARAGATEAAVERAGPVENSISADAQVDSQGNRASMSDLPKLTPLIKLVLWEQLFRGLPPRVRFSSTSNLSRRLLKMVTGSYIYF